MIIRDFTPLQSYKILSNTITPRPIAWVSSIFPSGLVNLAPFSFFAPISSNPPIFSLCMMNKSDGSHKDSFKNISTTGKASISMCDLSHLQALHNSSSELDFEQSEAIAFDIPLQILESGYPPVPQGVKVAFLCNLHSILELGEDKSVLLAVQAFYIDDEIYEEDLHFMPAFVGRAGRIYKSAGTQIFIDTPPKAQKNKQNSPSKDSL